MKIEQTIEAIRVMQAFVDGAPIECAERHNLKWGDSLSPVWNWNNFTYRIKPTLKLRPWTPDEVPLGTWMRKRLLPTDLWLITYTANEVVRSDWLEDCEHSTDCGKTWNPCGVLEESE